MRKAIRIRMAQDLADELAWKALYLRTKYRRSSFFIGRAGTLAARANRLRAFAKGTS